MDLAEGYARLWSPVIRPIVERLLPALPLAGARDACPRWPRRRLAEMGPDDFLFRPEIVFAVGHRPEDRHLSGNGKQRGNQT